MTDGAMMRSALGAAYAIGHHGAPGVAGVAIAERRQLAVVQVAAYADTADAVAAALYSRLGVSVPRRPNTTANAGATTILWVGPDRWLCVAPASLDPLPKLAEAFTAAQAAVTDLSHGRTVLRVARPSARDLLAKGCKIDLHPRVFPEGACAVSPIAHVGAILHAVGPEAFDVYVPRSYALHFWEWLTEAAAEFGYRVDPPRMEAETR